MSWVPSVLCAVAIAALAAMPSAQGGPPGTGLASPWVELREARVRLIAGPTAAKPAKAYLAGVEVTLAEGWKTYWRMPGDAGVPPVFTWTGSANVASIRVLYPAPSRLIEPGAQTIGYKNSAIFPVEVIPGDAARPVELRLSLQFGVCREICIPAEAAVSLTMDPSLLAEDVAPAMTAALDRVPRPQTSRRPGDPELIGATAGLKGKTPRLVIDARFPGGEPGADLFIEAPDGLYVPLPKRAQSAGNGQLRFEVDLSRNGSAGELRGKTLTLTFVSYAGATETTWQVP